MSQAKLREALAGGAPAKEKGPPVADGVLTETPDTPEAIEWRSRTSVIDAIASSSTYLDDDEEGSNPSVLYGKFTWRLDKFSDASKRELRSATFTVGPYRWYVLVYPHGCDVPNHLSLFLCVADYDKLLPGWSHFAQFTIAVVNADPKKSKYSDTLHRFCKKEHDWGWKKFMELGKVADGFAVNDSLVIKAQVQVIADRPARPLRALDAQYRRELARVYLANVEGIVRRFVDEKRAVLARLVGDAAGTGFVQFWEALEPGRRAQLASAPAPPLLKALVKRFFNEKEVTSTLVMDALYCGSKVLESAGRAAAGSTGTDAASSSASEPPSTSNPASLVPGLVIDAASDRMVLAGDVVAALRRISTDPVPPSTSEKPGDALALRNAGEGDDCSRDAVERDERRLADLGRRAVEMFGASHIVETQLEAAWAEAETIKRQEELIREEEEASRGEAERAAARAEADKERRARKKERQRAKKEAERAKKQAEEAEKARQEEERRAIAEQHRREAEERRRREEAEREAERERAAAAARQAAEAKRQADAAAKSAAKAAARAAKEQAAAAAAAAAATAPEDPPAVYVTPSDGTSSSGEDAASVLPAASVAATPAPLEEDAGSGPPSRAGTPDLSAPRAAAPAALSACAGAPPLGPAPTDAGMVDALSAEVRRLSAMVGERDEEIAALRGRVADLEARLAAAAMSRPGSALGAAAAPGALASEAASPAKVGKLENGHGGGLGGAHAPAAAAAAVGAPFGAAQLLTGGANPSDAILATASMMDGGAGRRPLGMSPAAAGGSGGAPAAGLPRQGSAPARPLMNPSAAQFAPSQPGQHPLPYSKAVAGGAGQQGGAAGLLPNGARMFQPQGPGAMQGGRVPADAGSRAFSSPLPDAAAGPAKPAPQGIGVLESPGLDDFAHMGLINDLLE